MNPTPVVETERLILRGWRDGDFDPLARMLANAAVMDFLGGVQPRPDAWRSLALYIGHWSLRGYGFWVVERKSDRAFLGRVGLWRPEGWPDIEIGWALDRPYWGSGYATEAAKAARDYGFRTYPMIARLISLIDPANRASERVAQRLGETKGASATIAISGHRYTRDVWEISRERWISG